MYHTIVTLHITSLAFLIRRYRSTFDQALWLQTGSWAEVVLAQEEFRIALFHHYSTDDEFQTPAHRDTVLSKQWNRLQRSQSLPTLVRMPSACSRRSLLQEK